MHLSCRLAGATGAAMAVFGLAACTGSQEDAGADAAPTTPVGVYGDPNNPVLPEPTFVATDPPVTLSPTTDGDIFLTFSEWNAQSAAVEVSGYLPNVREDDGTCVLTLTKAGTSVQTSLPATPDVSSTACGGLTVPGDQLSSGSWTAVVTYESSSSRGTSEPVEVEVP